MQKEISTQYLITVHQFIAEGYAEKIRRGECRVYEFDVEPPPEDAIPAEKAAYEHLKANGGLFQEIAWIESDNHVAHTANGLGSLGMSVDSQLLVITQENWQTTDGSQNALEAD